VLESFRLKSPAVLPTRASFPRIIRWVVTTSVACTILFWLVECAAAPLRPGSEPGLKTIVPWSAGTPEIHPGDPHLFVVNGRFWFPVGYYGGAALNMTGADYAGDYMRYNRELMDKLAANGINLLRTWINWGTLAGLGWTEHVEHPFIRAGPGSTLDGRPRFDLTQFNQAYFELIEQAVRYAQTRGIVVQIILLDCWHTGIGIRKGTRERDYFYGSNNINGITWNDEPDWADTNGKIFALNMRFVRKVVEAIGKQPNIIWETCNEKREGDHSTWRASATDRFHLEVAKVIRRSETDFGYSPHLIVPIDLPEHRTVAGHTTHQPSARRQFETIVDMRRRLIDEQRAWDVPLISDNDCCREEPDAEFMRRKAWAALTAGAHVSVFNDALYRRGVLSSRNTANGMRWTGLVRRFVEDLKVNLAGMQPADGLVRGGAWTIARPGREFILYLPHGGDARVSGLPRRYRAHWFDPREGTLIPAQAAEAFHAPDDRDWVLYIREAR